MNPSCCPCLFPYHSYRVMSFAFYNIYNKLTLAKPLWVERGTGLQVLRLWNQQQCLSRQFLGSVANHSAGNVSGLVQIFDVFVRTQPVINAVILSSSRYRPTTSICSPPSNEKFRKYVLPDRTYFDPHPSNDNSVQ